jgi:GTP-binding protein EngB required for normal cell division
LSCTLGEILKSGVDENKHIFFEFDMSDLIAGDQNTPKEFIVTIEATTVSNVVAVAKMDKILIIKAEADVAVFGGQKTVLFYPTIPAQKFEHAYNVSLKLYNSEPVIQVVIYDK